MKHFAIQDKSIYAAAGSGEASRSQTHSKASGEGSTGPSISEPLTRSQRLTVQRRQNVLARFDALVSQGKTHAEAAKELRVGLTSLWRWKRKIVPTTNNCGVHSAFENLNPPADCLVRVRRLQLAGMSNAAAWLALVEDPICPPNLALYLKGRKTVPASLLKATKLKRRTATILEGPEFTHIAR